MAYDQRFAIGFIGSSGAGRRQAPPPQLRRAGRERRRHRRVPLDGRQLPQVRRPADRERPAGGLARAGSRSARRGRCSSASGSFEVEGGWVDAKGMFLARGGRGSGVPAARQEGPGHDRVPADRDGAHRRRRRLPPAQRRPHHRPELADVPDVRRALHQGAGGRDPAARRPDVRRLAGPRRAAARDEPRGRRAQHPGGAHGEEGAADLRLHQCEGARGRAGVVRGAAAVARGRPSARESHVLAHRPQQGDTGGLRGGRGGERAGAAEPDDGRELALAALSLPARGRHGREAPRGAALARRAEVQDRAGHDELRRLRLQRPVRALRREERHRLDRLAEGGLHAPRRAVDRGRPGDGSPALRARHRARDAAAHRQLRDASCCRSCWTCCRLAASSS